MRLFILLCLALMGHSAGLSAETWRGEARVTFAGTSTLHDWEGNVSAKPFTAEVALVEGKVDRFQAEFKVVVAEMDTENEGRDENLRKAMRAEQHPAVLGKVDVRIPPEVVQGSSGKVPIVLRLLGKDVTVEGTIENWREEKSQVSFDYSFRVSLAASGIEIPSFLFFIRVGDEIAVHSRVVLSRR